MKKLIAVICLMSMSSTVFADCTKANALASQKQVLEMKSRELSIVADYLASRFSEPGGEFEGDLSVGLLLAQTRGEALSLTNQSARIQLAMGNELLACSSANKK